MDAVARDGGSMHESSRCVESSWEADGIRRKMSCVGLCACKMCVQSSSKSEDNWTCVCAANQPSAVQSYLIYRHWAATAVRHIKDCGYGLYTPTRAQRLGCCIYVKIACLRRAWSIRRTIPRS
jgi:hypothetical protein